MKVLITGILFFLAGPLGACAEYAVFLIPPALLENAHTVIRDYSHTYRVEGPGKAEEEVRKVVTVLNEQSDQGVIVLNYDQFRKVGKVRARLFNAVGEEIRVLSRGDLGDLPAYDGVSLYNDARVKVIDFGYADYPYTIEVTYQISHSGIQSYPVWVVQPFSTSVERSQFQLEVPDAIGFHYRQENLQTQPIVTRSDGSTRLTWSLTGQPAFAYEPYCPDGYNLLPLIMTAPDRFEVAGHAGRMDDWESFGQFIFRLNEGRETLSEEMAAQVRQMVRDLPDEREKIGRLYHYLQENMRYVSVQLGIGGWQTFRATYVEENKFGDCKALTWFMKGMLAEAGIPAYPALVYAGDRQQYIPREDFPAGFFNHVILYVPSADTWLECTSSDHPVNYLGSFTDDRPMLLITPKGGRLVRTPESDPNRSEGISHIRLTADGGAYVQSETTYNGTLQENLRGLARHFGFEDQKKWFTEISDLPSPRLESLAISAETDLPEARLSYVAEVKKYASRAGKRLFVPLNLVNPTLISLPEDSIRQHPIALPGPFTEKDELVLEIPQGFKLESLPQSVTTAYQDAARYRLMIRQDGKTVRINRELELTGAVLPATGYGPLRSFFSEVGKADRAKMVLVVE